MKKQQQQKVIVDFYFLLSLPCQKIDLNIYKRLKKPGLGEKLSQIKTPFEVYVSYDKFNYQGNNILQIYKIKVKNNFYQECQNLPKGVYHAIMSMTAGQESWFNITKQQLHLTKNLPPGQHGCHYHIRVQQIRFKNADTLQAKKLTIQSYKLEGRELFKKKNYIQAMSKYKYIISVTQNLDRKKFKDKNQFLQLKDLNINGKQNYLKCFAKVKSIKDEKIIQMGESYMKQLIKVKGQTPQNLYFKCHVQIKTKYLTDALGTARSLYCLQPQVGVKLIQLVKEKIQSKEKCNIRQF